jgi:hypothetical protein
MTFNEVETGIVATCYELGTCWPMHDLHNCLKAAEQACNEYWHIEFTSDKFTSSDVLLPFTDTRYRLNIILFTSKLMCALPVVT